MKNYFKMLVATDYSEAAINAEHYAIKLAKDTNSILTFLHVFKESNSFRKEFTELENVEYKSIDHEILGLEQHVANLLLLMGIKAGELEYKCVVRKGDAKEEIKNESNDSDIEFIVVGTHGETNLKQTFLGSHTWNTINKVSMPVLAIPAEATYAPVQSIVFATEYRKGELPVIKFLTKLAEQFDAELTVLHVTNDVFSREFEQEMFIRFMNEVKSQVSYDKLEVRLIHDANLIEGLNNFCIRTKSNWLVMAPEKSLLFEKVFNPITSRTKQMSFHTHVPLFTIPDYYNLKTEEFWEKREEKHNLTRH
jgi:nucleotide-binding universal stress UspA family protein